MPDECIGDLVTRSELASLRPRVAELERGADKIVALADEVPIDSSGRRSVAIPRAICR